MIDVDYVELLPLPRGWPEPFRPRMQKGDDFRTAFVNKGLLWVVWPDGSRMAVPLAHVLLVCPDEWPRPE